MATKLLMLSAIAEAPAWTEPPSTAEGLPWVDVKPCAGPPPDSKSTF